MKKLILILTAFCYFHFATAQDFDTRTSIGLFAGAMNYQGDLKPNSFTFQHSNLIVSLIARKPLNRWFAIRGGVTAGKVEAADKYNRDYLQLRNLSFASGIKEVFAALEADLLDISTKKFTPYAYGGIVLFHFKPYAFNTKNEKVFLQPLSTEGQGLPDYPDRKIYKLTQFAAAFGGGLRFAVSDCSTISLEFSQRKTFTDYLDDVSTNYVDQNKLMLAKGPQSVEMAFRGDELHPPSSYPPDGEQRGTPTEADWYYFFGLSVDVRLGCLRETLSGVFNGGGSKTRGTRCPTIY